MNASCLLILSLSFLCATLPGTASADSSPWSLGLRAGMSSADGEPSNDALTMGVAVRYRLSAGHHLGLALERMEFDFERPWRIVGVEQDIAVEPEDIDSAASSLGLSVFYDRHYGDRQGRWTPYWSVALAVASPDADPVTGPAVGGGTFDVHADPGTEIIPGARGGIHWNLGDSWAADFSLSANYHLADWSVVDRQSGNTAKVGNYTHYGLQLGLVYRFDAP